MPMSRSTFHAIISSNSSREAGFDSKPTISVRATPSGRAIDHRPCLVSPALSLTCRKRLASEAGSGMFGELKSGCNNAFGSTALASRSIVKSRPCLFTSTTTTLLLMKPAATRGRGAPDRNFQKDESKVIFDRPPRRRRARSSKKSVSLRALRELRGYISILEFFKWLAAAGCAGRAAEDVLDTASPFFAHRLVFQFDFP